MVDLNSRIHHNGKPPYKHTNLNTQNTVFDSFKTYIGLNQLGFHSNTIKLLPFFWLHRCWWRLCWRRLKLVTTLIFDNFFYWQTQYWKTVKLILSWAYTRFRTRVFVRSHDSVHVRVRVRSFEKSQLRARVHIRSGTDALSMSVNPWFWPLGPMIILWSTVGLQFLQFWCLNQIFWVP